MELTKIKYISALKKFVQNPSSNLLRFWKLNIKPTGVLPRMLKVLTKKAFTFAESLFKKTFTTGAVGFSDH